MKWRRLILTAGTKLPIAMVGRQTILMMGDVFSPATLRRHWFTALRRASSRVSSLAAERRPVTGARGCWPNAFISIREASLCLSKGLHFPEHPGTIRSVHTSAYRRSSYYMA
jgi:hypothetical protein